MSDAPFDLQNDSPCGNISNLARAVGYYKSKGMPVINHLYYNIKPIIPRRVQLSMRSKIAAYKRKKYQYIWPINPSAAMPPAGWTGWPEGKKFALALSHDVDTEKGYRKVCRLADLEERLGFRSCFNFVPERYGTISLTLIDELRARGFDVAVHGLKHDGKLFRSKHQFTRQAERINTYLKSWETHGFTSPSMHHNLEWMTALDIKYSISTFDTDPFEPQPDGVATIFPFLVYDKANIGIPLQPLLNTTNNGSVCRGYFVELPYTLPQDSTLFIILKERNIDIWKQKLEWVAANGGMALLNTHPDYMGFDHNTNNRYEYPAMHYEMFLKHIQRFYSGMVYNALPAEIAEYSSELLSGAPHIPQAVSGSELLQKNEPNERFKHCAVPAPARPYRTPLRAAMVTYSFYESDGRVRRYAETLAQRGDSVDVISLRNEKQASYGQLKGVNVYRVQKRVRDEKGKLDYLTRILKFFLRSASMLTFQHLKRPYDIIHVHSVPDFEVFAALVPKILRAGIILDIHDIVPELYANKFKVNQKSIIFKLLVLIEKMSTRFADHVIISNDLWKETLIKRSLREEKLTSIMNYPDESFFFKKREKMPNEKLIFLYPGTLNHHQGVDLAVMAFQKVQFELPNAEFHIYGEGPARKDIADLINRHGLENKVLLMDSVPLDEIPRIMAMADIGVIPKRNDSFGGEAFSTKTLEFMSLEVPIILARTRIDQLYFNDDVVQFFKPGNIDDLADAMILLGKEKILGEKQAANALKFADQYKWKSNKYLYLQIVDKKGLN